MASGFQPNAASAPETRATVVYGPYEEPDAAWVGMTVGQVRLARSAQFSIPSDAKAIRGTEEVAETYILQRGDRIEFARRQGGKG